jgi:transcriptional regulator with XRE-family HTH domain
MSSPLSTTPADEGVRALVEDEHRRDDTEAQVDWPRWMRALGRHKRQVREFLGLSQEQLARLAGVSQGAISRLEAGRGLATPLLVVVKINAALEQVVSRLNPALLSDEARRLIEADDHIVPSAESSFQSVPLLKDAGLEEFIRLYHDLSDRQRRKLLGVIRATVAALADG